MTDKNNRFLQGIVVAFIFHFLIAILLGLFEFHSNNYSPKILEITLGESGGGGGSGKKSSSGEKASAASKPTNEVVKQKTIETKKKIVKKQIWKNL